MPPLSIPLGFGIRIRWIRMLSAFSSSLIKPIGLVFIGLTLYHSREAVARAVPPSASIEQRYSSPSSSCNDLDHCRAKWSIIWSCLTTIFLCTWVAIHPNIPDIHDRAWLSLCRRLRFTVLLLYAPETVILFALRQRNAAARLAEQYHGTFHLCLHSMIDLVVPRM